MKIKFRRRSIRLPEYDYSRSGAYFITICSFNKELIFGNINAGKMKLSEIGKIVKKHLEEIPIHFENVFIDDFVIMPNHIHFIIPLRIEMKKNILSTYSVLASLCRGHQRFIFTVINVTMLLLNEEIFYWICPPPDFVLALFC